MDFSIDRMFIGFLIIVNYENIHFTYINILEFLWFFIVIFTPQTVGFFFSINLDYLVLFWPIHLK